MLNVLIQFSDFPAERFCFGRVDVLAGLQAVADALSESFPFPAGENSFTEPAEKE